MAAACLARGLDRGAECLQGYAPVDLQAALRQPLPSCGQPRPPCATLSPHSTAITQDDERVRASMRALAMSHGPSARLSGPRQPKVLRPPPPCCSRTEPTMSPDWVRTLAQARLTAITLAPSCSRPAACSQGGCAGDPWLSAPSRESKPWCRVSCWRPPACGATAGRAAHDPHQVTSEALVQGQEALAQGQLLASTCMRRGRCTPGISDGGSGGGGGAPRSARRDSRCATSLVSFR